MKRAKRKPPRNNSSHISNKAQSTLQYTMIVILIGTAILLAGPYVLRAINAHFKSTEDAIYDSFTDPLLKPDALPPISTCGDGSCCDTDECSPKETPQNCCADCGTCGDGVCCDYSKGGNEDVVGTAYYCPQDCANFCTGDGYCCTDPTCQHSESNNPEDQDFCCLDCIALMDGDGWCCYDNGTKYDRTEDLPETGQVIGVGADYGSPDCDRGTGLCNEDGTCDKAAGEDTLNCPQDCCPTLCATQSWPNGPPPGFTPPPSQTTPVCDTQARCFEDLETLPNGDPNPYYCPLDCETVCGDGRCDFEERICQNNSQKRCKADCCEHDCQSNCDFQGCLSSCPGYHDPAYDQNSCTQPCDPYHPDSNRPPLCVPCDQYDTSWTGSTWEDAMHECIAYRNDERCVWWYYPACPPYCDSRCKPYPCPNPAITCCGENICLPSPGYSCPSCLRSELEDSGNTKFAKGDSFLQNLTDYLLGVGASYAAGGSTTSWCSGKSSCAFRSVAECCEGDGSNVCQIVQGCGSDGQPNGIYRCRARVGTAGEDCSVPLNTCSPQPTDCSEIVCENYTDLPSCIEAGEGGHDTCVCCKWAKTGGGATNGCCVKASDCVAGVTQCPGGSTAIRCDLCF